MTPIDWPDASNMTREELLEELRWVRHCFEVATRPPKQREAPPE